MDKLIRHSFKFVIVFLMFFSIAVSADIKTKGIVIIPNYVESSDTFNISFESSVISDKTVFLYSYDQKNWSQFLATYDSSGVVSKGFHDSSLHDLIFFKAVAYGYEENISPIVLPYSDTVSLEYSPAAPVVDDKDDFFATWTTTGQSNGQFIAKVKQRYEGTSNNLGDVYIGIYLSSDTLCSTSDTFLGEAASTLSESDTFDSHEISFSLPSAANNGRWYLCAIADRRNDFIETSESNNTAYIILEDGVEYTLDPDAPDVIFTPSYNVADDSFSVVWRANNLSSGIRLSYSYDDSSWITLENIDSTVASSGTGAEIVQLDNSLVHTTVYFKMRFSGLDPDLDSDQTFNTTEVLNYQPLSDDFYVTWAYTENTNEQLVSHITQRYLGESSSLDDVSVGIYLSEDNLCSFNDELLGETSSSLSSGDRFDSETISFALPSRANTGRWYLCAIADNHRDFEEIDETNNASYIILEDGEEYTLHPDAPDVIFSSSYNSEDDTFFVEWRSSNLSGDIKFEYSYDNQTFVRFERIRSSDSDLLEGSRISSIPDSLLNSKIYIKARFSGPDPDLNNTTSSFSKRIELDYTPVVILLESLELIGSASLSENDSANYIAVAKYSDGSSKFVTASVIWSENSSYASIDNLGLLSTNEIANDISLVITASYSDGDVTKSASKTVTISNVIPVTLSSITISGFSELNENSTSTYSAIAHYSDSTSKPVSVIWSENSPLTTFNSAGELSTIEVNSDTNVTLAASYTEGGITKTDNKVVIIKNIIVPKTLNSITLTGASSINENSSIYYVVTANYSDGSTEVVTANANLSENSAFTSINNTGVLTADEVQQNELVTVSASFTYDSVMKSATIQVEVVDQNLTPQINLLNTWDYGQFSHIDIFSNYLYVSTYDNKIKILDFTDINDIKVMSEFQLSLDSGDYIIDVIFEKNHLYIIDNSYIHILDVRNVINPNLVKKHQHINIGEILGASLENDTLYVTYWEPGVVRVGALDIRNPLNINLLSHLDLSFDSRYYDLLVKGNYLYLLHEKSGIDIINITDPRQMFLAGALTHGGWFKDIAINKFATELYITNWDNDGEIIVVDITGKDSPSVSSKISTNGSPSSLQRNQEINLFDDNYGLNIYSSDFSEKIVGYSTVEGFSYVLRNNYIFAVNGNGLKVFEINPHLFQVDTDSDGIIDTEDLDDDNDGMPDVWEVKYNLNPLLASDALQDEDGDGAANYIEYLKNTNPLISHSTNIMTRVEISKPILQAKYGKQYVPSEASGLVFDDVHQTDYNSKWIENLAAEGITEGCDTNKFCPSMVVTKEQLSQILLKAVFGKDYLPTQASGEIFSDIKPNDYAAGWIEEIVNQGFSEGCEVSRFCPDELVTKESFESILEKVFP